MSEDRCSLPQPAHHCPVTDSWANNELQAEDSLQSCSSEQIPHEKVAFTNWASNQLASHSPNTHLLTLVSQLHELHSASDTPDEKAVDGQNARIEWPVSAYPISSRQLSNVSAPNRNAPENSSSSSSFMSAANQNSPTQEQSSPVNASLVPTEVPGSALNAVGPEVGNSLVEWTSVSSSGGTENSQEPTIASVLAFGIYYFLRKSGYKWKPTLVTGSTLLAATESEVEFGEYALPPCQSQQGVLKSLVSSFARMLRSDSQPQVILSRQFHWSQRAESAANSPTPPAIGDGLAIIERPHGHYRHLVFHVIRAMVEEYDMSFRDQHPDIDMVHNTRVDPHRLHAQLREMFVQLMDGGVREGRIIGMITFIGALAVQCYENQMFRVIDELLVEATLLFNELVEPWLLEHEYWVCTVLLSCLP